jgi:hypothetical protein
MSLTQGKPAVTLSEAPMPIKNPRAKSFASEGSICTKFYVETPNE